MLWWYLEQVPAWKMRARGLQDYGAELQPRFSVLFGQLLRLRFGDLSGASRERIIMHGIEPMPIELLLV